MHRSMIVLAMLAATLGGCAQRAPVPPVSVAEPSPAPPVAAPPPGAIVQTVEAKVPIRSEPSWIESVAFATPEHGWILFGDGVALETHDGGQTWQPTALQFREMNFYSPEAGLAAMPGAVYRTTDAGATWQIVDTTRWPDPMPQFVDEKHAWALTDTLYATADGGATWRKATSPCPGEERRPFSFISPRTGWVLCGWDGAAGAMSKRLFRTDDGGASWVLLGEALYGPKIGREDDKEWPGGLPVGDYSGSLVFTDERHGWWTGVRYGSLMATADGGLTWASQSSPVAHGGRVRALDARTAYEFGYGGVGGPVLSITRDGGQTWRQIYPIVRPHAVFYLDAQAFIGALGSTLYRSPDAGRSWQVLGQLPSGEELLDVAYTSPQQGWALTGAVNQRRLYKSGDGGATWQMVPAAADLHNQYAIIRAVNEQFAVLWDNGNNLLIIRDGGATYAMGAAPRDDFGGYGFDMRSPDYGWFSRSSLLHRTTTGPSGWTVVPMQEHQKAQGVALTPDGKVWALVVDVSIADTPVPMLLASTDEGKTWTRYDLGYHRASSLTRCGISSICVDGDGGLVSHDGGLTWALRK